MMKTNGQSAIWGAGAILICIGLVLVFKGYVDSTYLPEKLSYTYVNGTLTHASLDGSQLNISESLRLNWSEANYKMSTECDGIGTCTHTYERTSPRGLLSIIQYLVGAILLTFGGISFYMAHK